MGLSIDITCFQYTVCGHTVMTIVPAHTQCAAPWKHKWQLPQPVHGVLPLSVACPQRGLLTCCCVRTELLRLSPHSHEEKQLLVLRIPSVPPLGRPVYPQQDHACIPPHGPQTKAKEWKTLPTYLSLLSQTAFAFLSMCEVELSFMTVMFKSRTVPFLRQRIP